METKELQGLIEKAEVWFKDSQDASYVKALIKQAYLSGRVYEAKRMIDIAEGKI